MSGKRVRKTTGIVLALGAGVGVAGYFGLLPGGGERAKSAATEAKPVATQEPIAVTVAAATPRAIERRVRTVGTLHSYEEVEVAPLVDGHVRRILHDVGDTVAPGEPLIEIDDTDLRLAVQEMGRALELELAKLGLNAIPADNFDLETLPSVIRARLVEKNSAETFERYKALVERNAITKDDISKAELNLEVARLDTKQRLIEAAQSLASVRHRQAILETAQKKLRDAHVVTPPLTLATSSQNPAINLVSTTASSAGARGPAYTVAERTVSEGEIVRSTPPTKLFRLVVEDPLKFQAAVPERFAAQVRVGQMVDLAVDSLPGQKISGRVVRISPTVDLASRTFQVEASVANSERLLKPGSFATASILIGSDAQAVTVPEEAIVRFAGVTKLFAVAGDKVSVIPVETGSRMELLDAGGMLRRWVEVVGPVAPATQVVTTGHAQLSDGSTVRVREAAKTADVRKSPNEVDGMEARRLPAAGLRKESR